MDGAVASWWRVLRRRWLAGVALFVLVLVVAATALLLGRPVHRVEAKLRLGETPPLGGVSPSSGFVGLFRIGGDPFANDLELLSSRTLAEGVVDDAALNVALLAPRGWHRDSLVTTILTSRDTRKALYDVEWRGGEIAIRSRDGAGDVSAAAPGEPVTFGGVTLVLRPWRDGMPRRIRVKTIPHAEAARLVGARIGIERTRRDANVVRLRLHDTDPGVAESVVAAVVRRFVGLRTELQRRESGETVDSLRVIAERTRAELADAEVALERMQRSSGLVAPDVQVEATVTQYAEASAKLELARMELATLDAVLERTATDIAPADAWSALLSHPRFLENETLSALIMQLTGLEQQRRELARRRTPENIELRAVLEQIEYLDRSLRELAREHRSAIALQLASLEYQAGRFTRLLQDMPAHGIELARRQREARVLSEVMILTEQRLRQEQLRQALTFANVQVIDPPALRDRPVWPRRKVGLAVALMLASGTALLGMIVVERADGTVRSASETRAALAVPVLGIVRRYAPAPSALSAAEAAAVVYRGAVSEPGEARLALAAAEDGELSRIAADAIVAGTREASHNGGPRLAHPELTLLEPIDSFAAAAAAAAARIPLLLVVRVGATRRSALERARALLDEAGANVVGVILVCSRARDAVDAWT